jgi:DNA repair exonuclease SbcCD ATPase subunit
LRAANISVAQIPDLLDSVKILKGRMGYIEDRLRSFATSQGQLSAQLGALDGRVNSNLQEAHRETEQQIAQVEGRVSKELDQKNRVLDSRLTHVEQNQTDDRAQLAQLNQQLEQQVAALKSQLAKTQEGTRHGLETLDAQLGQNQQGLQDLGQKLHREKVTFEVPTKAHTEIVPGISLTILKTNTSRQRFQGYVSLAAEGRTLWLDNLGIEESLDLFPRGALHPYSLVITHIDSGSVAGYLLLPARA